MELAERNHSNHIPTHTDPHRPQDFSLTKPPQPPPNGNSAEGRNKYVLHSEKEPYDIVAHRCVEKPTNALESMGHLIKGCLGGGILGIHEAYMKCGLWTALILTVVFGFYITYCVHVIIQVVISGGMAVLPPTLAEGRRVLRTFSRTVSSYFRTLIASAWIILLLVKSAQTLYKRLHLPEMSYPDVAEAALEVGPFPKLRKYSKWFRYAVDIIICIDLFGACCVYQIIIAKTVKQLVENTEEVADEGNPHLRVYILGFLVPILLLCMITTLKYLAPLTLVADVFIVACVGATVYYSQRVAPPIGTVPAWKDVMGFFEFCGIVVFSMEGVGVSLPIENNMKDPSQFPLVLISGMSVVVSFVILVGFFGYWGWGENCRSPVTLNLPSEIFPIILKYLMAIMIFVTFALNFWAPFNLVWHYVSKRHNKNSHWFWERVYRAMFIVVITAIAIAFPNIGNLMGLLGAFCLSNMGFIFPAIIELLVVWKDPGLGKFKWRLWKNVVVMLIGILLFIAGTFSNLKGLINNI